ncbi:VOC family protein [Rhizosaccharibacter radicis]|uniref:VOC family protein n=1 Tax=Rhizosaccharibacter radicis TaxID=2782605 RepID=A0ABT1VSV1_9PROT|nr:VOC family protein [Acetobacteraceae bacterium KSS12]
MIDRLDHLVLTVRDIERTRRFYRDGLGMEEQGFGEGRVAFRFGGQKLNIHLVDGDPILPRADRPTPGSADLCFIADRPLDEVMVLLRERGLAVAQGPVARTGARGSIRSVYLRDPDENLVEISEYC